ncbi:MAG: G-D-S-L family lipolytic protein [Flavobacterium sp.]|uniref:G-D-S-L family lipolytic protein n=1 Tax=Flavobacterium sp. TaxID=239 RepID=UPI00120350F8|nr:G-D-S-L family lipolytic protein [Flavobacterium sp.]RZJ68537.1 MAG: G-D-S-L family lipolytic protein [Flavobacterium sp.]
MIKNFKWLVLASLTLVACSDDDNEGAVVDEPITAGSADFSKYVALGDSFAAGYSDNALFRAGQENSYPNILASQFALAGGGAFTQPLMVDNIGGFSMGGAQIPQFPTRLYLTFPPGATSPAPTNVSGVSGTVFGTTVAGPFNNVGVPGAKSFHLTFNGYGSLNPYFGRFASSATASPFGDALAQNPTFFTLWIGGNDVLSYATSGGAGVNQTGNFDPTTYGGNDITDPNVFANVYGAMVDGLTANGAKGAVANLPYVNTLPFFTRVPYNPIPLDAATANQLNSQLLGPVIQILTALGQGDRIHLLEASATNAVLIKDESLVNLSAQLTGALIGAGVPAPQAGLMGNLYGQARHAKVAADGSFRDFVLLSASSTLGTSQPGVPAPFNTIGVTYPLQDGAVLTNTEAAEVRVATDAYNTTIEGVATAKGLALVDAKAIMNQLLNGGIRYGNYHMTATYATGGTFSLDGVHPSARGYALIANKFLEAINATYGSNFKGADLGSFTAQYGQNLP